MQTNTFQKLIITIFILASFYFIGVTNNSFIIDKPKEKVIENSETKDENSDLSKIKSIFDTYKNTFYILIALFIFTRFNRKIKRDGIGSIFLSIIGFFLIVVILKYFITDINIFFKILLLITGVTLAYLFKVNNKTSINNEENNEEYESDYSTNINFFILFILLVITFILYLVWLFYDEKFISLVLFSTNLVIVLSIFFLFMNGKNKTDALVITLGSILAIGNLTIST
ncbi:MAG: hypothetical protein GY932_08245 [Arcobacter sp.]|nr:hypothetical protein [Arcobacter sp.]